MEWNEEKNHKDIKKKHTERAFPAESEKHNMSESQAECWISAVASDVSSLLSRLGAGRNGRGESVPASSLGASSKDPSLK